MRRPQRWSEDRTLEQRSRCWPRLRPQMRARRRAWRGCRIRHEHRVRHGHRIRVWREHRVRRGHQIRVWRGRSWHAGKRLLMCGERRVRWPERRRNESEGRVHRPELTRRWCSSSSRWWCVTVRRCVTEAAREPTRVHAEANGVAFRRRTQRSRRRAVEGRPDGRADACEPESVPASWLSPSALAVPSFVCQKKPISGRPLTLVFYIAATGFEGHKSLTAF